MYSLKLDKSVDAFPRWCFERNLAVITMILFFVDFAAFMFYKSDSLLSLIIGYLFLLIINRVSTKAPVQFITFCYFLIALIGIIVVLGLQTVYPSFYGMTDSSATGTDDLYFYVQAVMKTDNSLLGKLPNARPDAYYREVHSYSNVLRIWNAIICKFVDVYPIDLLIFNYIGISIGCAEATKLCFGITEDLKNSSKMLLLMLFCPFMLSSGLVLIRDAWVATLFIIITERMWKEKYINALPAIGLLLYLRVGAILELLFLIWFIINAKSEKQTKRAYLILFLLVSAVVGVIFLRQYSDLFDYYFSQLNGLTRTGIISETASDTRSVMYRLPSVLRIPLMTILYIIMPTFNIGTFFKDGIFNIRNFIYTLFGLTNLYLLPNYINAVFYSFKYKEKTIRAFAVCFIVMMVIVSQIDQVARHKTAFVYLYYLVAVYGVSHSTSTSKLVGKLSAVCLLAFYVFSFII